ncbi:uncharacterized protein [Rutidosis leptorrhynchoides]|uniref:uncharacterized protein n=1 Tax=Rutidosis leptorrhynchoides TaxID=125765 RepID=UPI003A9A3806
MVPKRELWKNLSRHKRVVVDKPWVLLGDFNATIDPDEHSAGPSFITKSMGEFSECVVDIEVEDISWLGLRFTWNQTPGILKKLDRAMGNVEFFSEFPSAVCEFMLFLRCDHSPMVVTFPQIMKSKPKPFKFHNYLTTTPSFLPAVNDIWKNEVYGHSMFAVVSKMKFLKKPLRKLNYEQGNLFLKTEKLKLELERVQQAM